MTRCKIGLLVLLFAVTGCVDNVDSVTREYRAANNEAIDALMMVTTEAEAERMTTRIFKPLSDRYDKIDRKLGIVRMNREKKEFIKEVLESDSVHLYLTDLQINTQRFSLEMLRLRRVVRQYQEREAELQGEKDLSKIDPKDICPKLYALVHVEVGGMGAGEDVLGKLVKQLAEPELLKLMADFPNWKVAGYNEVYDKFAKRRKEFVPKEAIELVR